VAFPEHPAAELPWITVEQMREVDRIAIESGLDLPRMMENAGANLAAVARELLGGDVGGRRVAVLAGAGGNGGGGMVAARRLAAGGAEVELRLGVDPAELTPVPAQQYALLGEFGVTGAAPEDDAEPELLIDALLGYSQRGAARGRIAELVEAAAGYRVLALDTPTGLELQSGEIRAPAIRAEATLTLALPKRGLGSAAARVGGGDLYLADISIPPTTYQELGISHPTPFGPGPIVRLTGPPPASVDGS